MNSGLFSVFMFVDTMLFHGTWCVYVCACVCAYVLCVIAACRPLFCFVVFHSALTLNGLVNGNFRSNDASNTPHLKIQNLKMIFFFNSRFCKMITKIRREHEVPASFHDASGEIFIVQHRMCNSNYAPHVNHFFTHQSPVTACSATNSFSLI